MLRSHMSSSHVVCIFFWNTETVCEPVNAASDNVTALCAAFTLMSADGLVCVCVCVKPDNGKKKSSVRVDVMHSSTQATGGQAWVTG